MKSFNQFLTEAEDCTPLNLTEAVEWFCVFDEELNEVEKLEVLGELTEEDLVNLAWLKEYLIEVAANKVVPFKRVQTDLDKLLKQIRSEKTPPKPTTPNPQQYTQPAGSQRPTSDLKVGKKGLEAARDVARGRQPVPSLSNVGAKNVGAPTSTGKLRQSVSNLKSKITSKLPSVKAPKMPAGFKGAAGSYVKNVRDPLAAKINTPFVKAGEKITQAAAKVPGGSATLKGLGAVGRFASRAAVPVDAALNVANRKMQGQSWKRSIAGGAAETGGGLAAGAAGAALGTAILPGVGTVIGGITGYMAGSGAAGKAFDDAAGATPQQKKAMATANRQRQAGTGIVGTGGPTKVNTKKNTITTGGKTVALPKMQVNPQTGKAGYLAYKGGQATYKTAADPSTLAKTSSNPLERLGRTINPGAYAKQDAAAKAAQLKQAQAGTASYKKSLGIK
jgi:hypothetical protein